MNKYQFATEIATDTGSSIQEAIKFIDSYHNTIKNLLYNGVDVQIKGFATFYQKKRKAKTGMNISKGEQVIIPEKTIPKIRFHFEI